MAARCWRSRSRVALVAHRGRRWRCGSACCASAALPILWGVGFAAGRDRGAGAGAPPRRRAARSRPRRCLRPSASPIFAWNNAPNESTGLPPAHYDALRPDTADETVALLKAKLKAAAAPDRRDRVELIGIAYHWPNIGLIHDFDHLFGHNPLRLVDFERATAAPDTVAGADQRQFTPLMPSYRSTLENLFGVRFIAIGVPVEQIDPSLKPGDLDLVARTKDAYVYENPRALPRVLLATRMAQGRFRRDDPRRRLAGRRSAPHGAAGAARRPARRPAAPAAPRASCATTTPRSRSRPMRRAAASRAQRRLASVVAGERRRQAGGNPQGQRAVPRGRGAARQARRALHASIRSPARSPS